MFGISVSIIVSLGVGVVNILKRRYVSITLITDCQVSLKPLCCTVRLDMSYYILGRAFRHSSYILASNLATNVKVQ